MRTSRLDRFAVLLVVILLGVLVANGTGTSAAFLVSTDNPSNAFSSIPDWKAPLISRATVIKAEGGMPGYVRASGSYRVVASVVDDPSSNPPAGIASVRANVGALTTGATALTLTAGAFTVFGQTYTHQSAAQTVIAGKAEGTYSNSVTAQDAVTPANAATLSFDGVVDNTVPAAGTVAIANGGIAGRPDAGDTITLTYNDIVDPHSVISGWTGGSTPVTLQVANAGGAQGDTVTVRNSANTAQLSLGSVALRTTDYVTATTTFGGPANATRSTMTWSSVTGAFLITLGPPDAAGTVNTTATTATNMRWTPSNTAFDRAGNLCNTTTWIEPGGATRKF